MKLKHSYAGRISSEHVRDVTLTAGSDLDLVTGKRKLVFGFDLGSAKYKELVSVNISPSDFKELAVAMMKADKDGALKAFAEAILES